MCIFNTKENKNPSTFFTHYLFVLMKISLKHFALAGIMAALVFTTSCKKEETTTTPTNIDANAQKTAEDRNEVTLTEDDLSELNDYANRIDPNSTGGRTEGTVLGAGNTSFDIATRTLTIDFGATNVVCSDGRTRRGKVIIRFTQGRPRDLNYSTLTTHENYFVNDIKVEGSRTDVVTVNILQLTAKRVVTITNRKLTFKDNTTITENGTYNYDVKFNNTFTDFDVTLTGGGTGINRFGQNYTVNITDAITAKASCFYGFPTKGKLEIAVVGLADKVFVDYGNGTCDKSVVISYKNNSVTVNL